MAFRLPFPVRIESGDYALMRRLLADNAQGYIWRYVSAFVAMAVFAATTGAAAWLMRDVIDGIFLQGDTKLLIIVPIAMGALFVTRGASNYYARVTLARIGNAVVARIQRRIFDKVLQLEIGALARTHSAALVAKISHHTLAARETLQQISGAIRDLLTLVVLTAVMIWQSPLMSLFVLVAAPVAIGAVTYLTRRTRKAAESEFRLAGRLGALLQETAIGIRVIRAFNLENPMRTKMHASIEDAEAHANKVATYSARATPVMESIAGIAVAGILLWTGYSVVNLGASPGAFISFVTALLLAYEPALRLAGFNVHFAGKMAGVRIIYELLDTPAVQRLGGRSDFAVGRGEISFDRVSFRYRADEPLFDDLSFTAAAGKTTALVGPSGVGKSTVISLIERFYEPTSGRILIDGEDIAGIDPGALRAAIALVGQDVRLFGGSVRENIRYGRFGASDAEVERAAAEAMADEFIRALPDGYNTELGEQGAELSGGQRQRIAIARALLRDAPIVLLDEATSALDSESEVKVQAAFDRLKEGRTTIVIAHRLSTVRSADNILVFRDGAIVEEGSHAELLAAKGSYARFHRLQLEPDSEDAAGPETAGAARARG